MYESWSHRCHLEICNIVQTIMPEQRINAVELGNLQGVHTAWVTLAGARHHHLLCK